MQFEFYLRVNAEDRESAYQRLIEILPALDNQEMVKRHVMCREAVPLEKCHFCAEERSGPWCLMFGKPEDGKVVKKHVCPDCWKKYL